jgi:hypothetical protein
MKLDTGNTTIQKSRDFENHAMGIDPKHMDHIISLLTDAYANPIRAVLREYATNGLDSHREAGVQKPVIVSLPSALTPNLVFTDHGLGLSRDEIIQVYSQYGASTKRDTNTQIGGFGIGAKSAFTVADQFTVIGVKDGIKTTVLFTRTNEGGSVNVLSERPTDEENGVRVSIPIAKDHAQYEQEAKQLYSYWSESDIAVDTAEAFPRVNSTYEMLLPGVWVESRNPDSEYSGTWRHYNHSWAESVYVRMGNAPYRFSADEYAQIFPGRSEDGMLSYQAAVAGLKIVIDIPVGSVDLSPSREHIILNAKSITYLQELFDSVSVSLASHYLAEIDNQPSLVDAIRYVRESGGAARAFSKVVLYKGQAIPSAPEVELNTLLIHVAAGYHTDIDHREAFQVHPTTYEPSSGPARVHYGHYNNWETTKVIMIDIDQELATTKIEALRDTKRGRIRRNILAWLRANREQITLSGHSLKKIFTDGIYTRETITFVLQSEVGDDPYIMSMNPEKVRLSEMIAQVNSSRKSTKVSGVKLGRAKYAQHGKNNEPIKMPELIKYKNIFYTDTEHSRWAAYCDRLLKDSPEKALDSALPADSIVIIISGSQRVASLQKIIDKVDGVTLHDYNAWRKAELEKRVKSLTLAERTQVERMSTSPTGAIWTRVIQPLTEASGLTLEEGFARRLASIASAKVSPAEATDPRYRYMIILSEQVTAFDVAMPAHTKSITKLVQDYPFLPYIAGALTDIITKDDNALAALSGTVAKMQ